jgi:hypothetical protein
VSCQSTLEQGTLRFATTICRFCFFACRHLLLFSSQSDSILEWRRIALPDPKAEKLLLIPRLVKFVHEFKSSNAAIADEATVVAVEQQMAASMRIMEAVLHSQFVGRARSVNPGQVKRFYRELYPELVPQHKDNKKTKSISYALGKRLIVGVAKQLLPEQSNPVWAEMFAQSKKKDDFADCFCQAVYVSKKREMYLKN